MLNNSMNRKEFLTTVGRVCACSCVGALALGLINVYGDDSPKESTGSPESEESESSRAQERIEFAEKWAVRFFGVLDANIDEVSRKNLMMANGKACLLAWQEESGKKPKPITFEEFKKHYQEKPSPAYQIDGNTINFQYVVAAETGKPAPKAQCLCPLVENCPKGLSPTYCLCSLGYVKEMHEQRFGRPVEVELVDSVLRGGERCKFRISVG